MRRHRRWLIGASAFAVLAVTWLVLQPDGTPINEEAFVQIRAGMTDQEVEGVFRNMPGYRDDGTQFMRRMSVRTQPEITYRKEWCSPGLTIAVDMDQSGRVTAAHREPGQPLPNNFWMDRVNRWLGRTPTAIPATMPPPAAP